MGFSNLIELPTPPQQPKPKLQQLPLRPTQYYLSSSTDVGAAAAAWQIAVNTINFEAVAAASTAV
ncbi:hypothetical protein Sjap_008028 [Stephania japonica]|uniref:Uncharacterized protein n=1 Tax=Stephania japonica TaxID=461633 RepID=A0AAP0JPD4_9MAGN